MQLEDVVPLIFNQRADRQSVTSGQTAFCGLARKVAPIEEQGPSGAAQSVDVVGQGKRVGAAVRWRRRPLSARSRLLPWEWVRARCRESVGHSVFGWSALKSTSNTGLSRYQST